MRLITMVPKGSGTNISRTLVLIAPGCAVLDSRISSFGDKLSM